jgi:hypothetical protein
MTWQVTWSLILGFALFAPGLIGMGLIAGHAGYPAVFLLTAALAVTALLPARRERAHSAAGR